MKLFTKLKKKTKISGKEIGLGVTKKTREYQTGKEGKGEVSIK